MGILDKLRAPTAFVRGAQDPAAATAGKAPHIATERRRHPRRNVRTGTRALIADDSPDVVSALKEMLKSAGFVTMEAAESNLALALARGGIPDLIFLDIMLPPDKGFAVLRTLRKDPATAHVPVIMMSGNERATELFFGRRIGADDFMKKPFSRHEVFARIERLLDDDGVPRRLSPVALAPDAG